MIPKKPKLLERTPVASSNLKSAGYDAREEVLQIEFHSGVIGDYLDVPPYIYKQFLAEESKGAYLGAHIKPIYKWRPVQKSAVRIDTKLEVATPLYLALLETRKLMQRTGGNLLYSLWVATGREPTRKKKDTQYAAALALLGEVGAIGGEKELELAIKLAAKRRV